MFPWFGLVFMLAFAAIFYKAAEFEGLSMPIAWGGGSVLLYLGTVYGLDWGLCGVTFLQICLFMLMGVWIAMCNGGLPGVSLAEMRKQNALKRGRCPGCGYDLAGTLRPGTCPECGHDLPSPRD